MGIFERLSAVLVIGLAPCFWSEIALEEVSFDATRQRENAYNLDNQSVYPGYDLSLYGRLNNVPVSKVFYGKFAVTGSGPADQTRAFRVSCVTSTDPLDACDPGLIIKGDGIVAHEYHNSTAGNGYGAIKTFTYAGNRYPLPNTTTFDVLAYSHHRGTSQVKVEFCGTISVGACGATCSGGDELVCDTGWTSVGFTDGVTGAAVTPSDVHVGGTLVHVGTVQQGDTFEVRSSNDGVPPSASTGTRMWLFNKELQRYAFVDDGDTVHPGENDPFFTFPTGNAVRWDAFSTSPAATTTSGVYALIGKDDSNAREVWVDLVHGPLQQDRTIAAAATGWTTTSCFGNRQARVACTSKEFTLSPGRHMVTIKAMNDETNDGGLESGFGDTFVAGEENRSGDAGDPVCGGAGYGIYRGRGNYLAFTMQILRDGTVIATRHVPLTALGGKYPTWHRFGIDVSNPDDQLAHTYQVRLTNLALKVDPAIITTRNPEGFEIKVAESNLEYSAGGSYAQTTATLHNVADLLGGKTTYIMGSDQIHNRNTRGRWRWESDIIAFNEIEYATGADSIEQRLETSTGLGPIVRWTQIRGEGKHVTDWGIDRYSVTYLRGRAAVGTGTFSPSAMSGAGCGESNCFLEESTFESWWMVPAKAQALAYGSAAAGTGVNNVRRPIAVMNFYLPHKSLDHLGLRGAAINNLIDRVKGLMDQDGSAFNPNVTSGGTAYNDPNNRFIVIGDSNMQNMRCGEIAPTINKLRSNFGYAVDVATVALDKYNRTFDGHWNGKPITDLTLNGSTAPCVTGEYTNPSANLKTGMTGTKCFPGFRHSDLWVDEAAAGTPNSTASDTTQRHSWWAQTEKSSSSMERLDVILLVGLGWADDDPVKNYKVLGARNAANDSNGYGSGGIRFVNASSCTPYESLSTTTSYAPEKHACTGASLGTVPAAPAIATDHRPVGVKLRLQMR